MSHFSETAPDTVRPSLRQLKTLFSHLRDHDDCGCLYRDLIRMGYNSAIKLQSQKHAGDIFAFP
jgi:hypothetical protein